LEVRRIQCGGFSGLGTRDRHGYVVCLDFMAPHRHLVMDVIVTRARTNSRVSAVPPLPFPSSLMAVAWHAKLFVNLRTSTSLGTPSVY
jgi:hypothetical protein